MSNLHTLLNGPNAHPVGGEGEGEGGRVGEGGVGTGTGGGGEGEGVAGEDGGGECGGDGGGGDGAEGGAEARAGAHLTKLGRGWSHAPSGSECGAAEKAAALSQHLT